MGKLRDELKYRTGHCSFEWAEEYEAKKRAERPINKYRVTSNHHQFTVDTAVDAQSPMEAVEILLNRMVNLDRNVWMVQPIGIAQRDATYMSVRVIKLTGVRRTSWYDLIIETHENFKRRNEAMYRQEDERRREQFYSSFH